MVPPDGAGGACDWAERYCWLIWRAGSRVPEGTLVGRGVRGRSTVQLIRAIFGSLDTARAAGCHGDVEIRQARARWEACETRLECLLLGLTFLLALGLVVCVRRDTVRDETGGVGTLARACACRGAARMEAVVCGIECPCFALIAVRAGRTAEVHGGHCEIEGGQTGRSDSGLVLV
jgi:hypothetical protein